MPNQKTSKRRLAALQNQQTAIRYRSMGLTYDRIGAEMGVSRAMAQKYVAAAMREIQQNIIELAQQERERQLMQTALLLEKHFPKAEGGNVKSTELCLAILGRRAKITGADLPEKIAPVTPDGDKPYDPITDTERLERLTAILESGRKRRDLEASVSTQEGGTNSQ